MACAWRAQADAKAVNKIPVRSRVCCASWTNDGNYLALGLANGPSRTCTRAADHRLV
jgi:hypothetical protein